MVTQTDQFLQRDAHLPKPKYNYGDRVFARLNKVPVVGMVIRQVEDTVLVHSDLPLRVEEQIRYIVSIPIKGMTRLIDMNGTCHCGRTLDPNGDCDTSHSLTEEQYQKMLKRRKKK